MADRDTNGTEDLVQAYDRSVEKAIGAFDAGVAQATGTVKLMTGAVETERREFGGLLEQGAAQARRRGENLAAVFPGLLQGFAANPATGAAEFGPEVKDSINRLIEGETAFYDAMTQAWMNYISGAEQRRSAAAGALLEGNAKAIEASQQAARGAMEFGEALFNWSMETATAQNPKG